MPTVILGEFACVNGHKALFALKEATTRPKLGSVVCTDQYKWLVSGLGIAKRPDAPLTFVAQFIGEGEMPSLPSGTILSIEA